MLYGVDEIAPNDVWAVGARSDILPFLRHWDGGGWRSFAGPAGVQELYAVDDVSSTDVWAAGHGGIIHWDGSAWTTSYSTPDLIRSLVAVSADDVWAVEYDFRRSFTVHWDGSAWSRVGKRMHTDLVDIAADGPDDVWAVAYGGGVERWDGTSWTWVAHLGASLSSVAVVAPDDVWVAGDDAATPPDEPEAAVLHWDGHQFASVDVPTPGMSSRFESLGFSSATDVWAVGETTPVHGPTRSLIEHWRGKRWHIRPAPDSPYSNFLSDVSAANADDAYAVGQIREKRFRSSSLTLHWDGTAWTRVG